MSDYCENCNEEIRDAGMIRSSNYKYSNKKVGLVNSIHATEYTALCESCGKAIVEETISNLGKEQSKHREYIEDNVVHFPMMTVSLPTSGAKTQYINMITANVTTGTGLFNEMSQGFSDFFGATSINSGMALKVNQGEAVARAIMARKARATGGNCILGVDVDYGTTSNNAATVNMQGTAAFIANLEDVLRPRAYAEAQALEHAFIRLEEISNLLDGCF